MPPPRPSAAPDPQALVDLTRQLGGLLHELGLGEIEVAAGDVRIRLARPAMGAAAAAPAPAPALTGVITVESPMVGTFYRAASPTAEVYVREGDVVKEGQILCIIEAMKLMNEIESKVAGRISKILVDNAQAVEYGQALFLIEPVR